MCPSATRAQIIEDAVSSHDDLWDIFAASTMIFDTNDDKLQPGLEDLRAEHGRIIEDKYGSALAEGTTNCFRRADLFDCRSEIKLN